MSGAALRFVLLVLALLVLAAVSLWPRPAERVAMLADEGRHTEVIALAEQQLAERPGDPDLLAALGRSYAALGEHQRAMDTFDAYLAARPDDLAAREREAVLFLQNGLVDRYLDALTRLVAAHPTPGRVTQLVELYRLHGRLDDELATLRAYAGRAMLEPPQLERLGTLLAERGNWAEARRWLEAADQVAPPADSAGRFLLLEVLIQDNAPDEAYRRARTWMTTWHSSYLSTKLIIAIAQSGLVIPASKLALKCVDLIPDETFEVAGALFHKGRRELAQQMIVRWADRTTNPSDEQLRAFVYASAQIGDVRAPIAKFEQLISDGADPATQGMLAEELVKAFGTPALTSVWPLLSNEALLTRPLFAAELSMFEGNREMARRYLNRIEPMRLSPAQRVTWLALLRRIETQAGVYDRLAALWQGGRLPVEMAPLFADEALKANKARVHDLVWNSMRR